MKIIAAKPSLISDSPPLSFRGTPPSKMVLYSGTPKTIIRFGIPYIALTRIGAVIRSIKHTINITVEARNF